MERLEPDVHYFIPVTLTSKKGHEPYYMLNCTQKIMAERLDLSQLNYTPMENEPPRPGPPSQNDILKLDANAVAGKHLWYSRWRRYYFLSDELFQSIKVLKRLNLEAFRVVLISNNT